MMFDLLGKKEWFSEGTVRRFVVGLINRFQRLSQDISS